MAATLIERFPHENDPQRPVEEKHAKNVAATTYIGSYNDINVVLIIMDGTLTLLFYHWQPALIR